MCLPIYLLLLVHSLGATTYVQYVLRTISVRSPALLWFEGEKCLTREACGRSRWLIHGPHASRRRIAPVFLWGDFFMHLLAQVNGFPRKYPSVSKIILRQKVVVMLTDRLRDVQKNSIPSIHKHLSIQRPRIIFL